MSARSWFDGLFRGTKLVRRHSQRATSRSQRATRRLVMEGLEERTVLAAAVDFLPAQIYASGGNGPIAVAVGDFNDDGNDDLAAANFTSSTVGVQLGDGSGGFAAAVSFASGGTGPKSVVVGDFNKDGNADLAMANLNSHNVGVLLGDGSGGFAAAVSFASGGSIPQSVAVADINSDGNDDLVAANYGSHTVGVLLGNGSGGFAPALTFASGGSRPYAVAAGDFDHDGDADLAVANLQSAGVGVLLGNGSGGFSPAVSYASGGSLPDWVVVEDFNNDGHADLAVENEGSNSVGVLIGNGSGGFAAAVTYSSGGSVPVALAVEDFNHDGNADLAMANLNSHNVGVLLGDGSGGFAAAVTFASGSAGPRSATVGDFNNDDKADLALSHFSSNIVGVLLNSTVTNQPPVNTVPGDQIAIEDMATVIGGLSVADDAAGLLTVSLSVEHGTLTVAGGVAGGLTGGDISGNGTGSVALTGTAAQINATLAAADGLTYLGGQDYFGPDALTMTTTDAGGLSDTDAVNIEVLSPPVNTVPGDQVAFEDVAQAIGGLSVADDAAGLLTVVLTIGHGTLTVAGGVAGGLSVADISGNGTASLALTGTQAQINATLGASDGLLYVGTQDYSGLDTLTITTTDADGLSDTDAVAIEVLSAQQQADAVAAIIADLEDDGVLSGGQENALLKKLSPLSGPTAEQRLQAFINQVNGLANDGILTLEQADDLIGSVQAIIASMQ